MKQILLIKGSSQYGATSVFLEEIGKELEKQGMEIDILDSHNENSYVEMRYHIRHRRYDAVFSINGMGLEESSSLGSDVLREKVIYSTMLVDHPLIHHKRLKYPYAYKLILSPDYHHVEYLEKYYPDIWCEGFLAHAGCQAKKIVPYRERSIAVSFMGSYSSPEEIWEEFQNYPLQMRPLLEGCCRYLRTHTDATLEQALLDGIGNLGIVCPVEEFAAIGVEFRIVDRYIRAWFREQVLRSIVEAGIVVDVYGDGWEKFKVKNRNCLRIHDRIEFRDSLEITADSKISLNVMPWFKNGSHERVFSAMLCGSVCLTDVSDYLREECQDEKELLFYQLDEIEQLPNKIRNILNHDEIGERIAMEGRRLAEEKHTWAVRARELLDYLLITEQMKKEQ